MNTGDKVVRVIGKSMIEDVPNQVLPGLSPRLIVGVPFYRTALQPNVLIGWRIHFSFVNSFSAPS